MALRSGRWAAAVASVILLAGLLVVFLSRRRPDSGSSALLDALDRPTVASGRAAPYVQSSAARQPDATELAGILRDSSWQARLGAVNSLGERHDIPAKQKAELL